MYKFLPILLFALKLSILASQEINYVIDINNSVDFKKQYYFQLSAQFEEYKLALEKAMTEILGNNYLINIQYNIFELIEKTDDTKQSLVRDSLYSQSKIVKEKYNNELNITFDRFTDLIPNISEKKLELIANSEKIFNNIKQITEINALKLENINNQLIQMSPNKILERGYATLQDKTGKQITSISNIKIGDKITTKIIDGKIGSIIENINNKEK